MADDIILPTSDAGGATVAADLIGAVYYPRSKISLGADGTAVDATGGAGAVGTDTQRVTLGSDDPAVTALELIDNAVSGAGFNITQFAGAGISMGTGVRDPGTQRVTIATDDAVPVTGTFYQATQPVSGTVTANAGTGTFAVSLATVPTHAVTQSGPWDIGTVSTVSTVTTCSTVTTLTGSGVASGATDSGNPHKIGGVFNTTQPTVTTGQRVDLQTNNRGALLVASGVNGLTVSTLTQLQGSSTAHDGADSTTNPHKIGARATTSISGQTPVANNDRTNLYAGVDGVLVTRPHCNLEDVVRESVSNTDGTSTAMTVGLAAPGAGIKLNITKITISNSSATFCTVDIRDGAAGAVLWTIPAPATGGACEVFDVPLRFTANTAFAYDVSAAISTVTISAVGFKSAV